MHSKMLNQFWTLLLSVSLISMLGLSTPAWALDLKSAKAQGLVGEKQSGYLGAVKSSAGVKELITQVNEARKVHYKKIAKRNATSLEVVEVLAGKKAIEKAAVGHYVESASGSWVKK